MRCENVKTYAPVMVNILGEIGADLQQRRTDRTTETDE